jgi:PmbA protein
MMNPECDDLIKRATAAVELAKQMGATASEVAMSTSAGLTAGVRLGEVENLEHSRSLGLSVTVYKQHQKGNASTSDWSEAAVASTIQKALAIAEFISADPCAGLPDEVELAVDIPDLELDHPSDLSAEQALEQALQCEAIARDFDPRITNSEGASVSTHRSAMALANSYGWSGAYAATSYSLSVSVVGAKDKQLERDYWYSTARRYEDLESPEVVGQEAARRCVARLGARRLATQKAPVLFVPEHARGLISPFVQAMGGTAQYRQSSFLLNGDGQRWFPDWMQMSERPHLKRRLGSAPFDSEGVNTRDRDWVVDGVVNGYLLSSYSARKLKLKTTGHASGVHNLLLKSNAGSLSELIQQMGRGLVVTELMGQGVNAITGDYSRGAAGFWVENGEIQYPVNEITIASNLKDMYQRIVAIGNDIDQRGSILCGSIWIDEMTIAGN